MTDRYDVIVVGASCAGSPTAMLLARKGYKVLVVDRARFPGDTVSTHLLGAVSGNQDAMDAFTRLNAGVVSPAEFFSGANVGRILAAAS